MTDPPRTDDAASAWSVRWRRIQPWIAGMLLVVGAGNAFHVPYYSLGPGPATDVLDLVEVQGRQTYGTDGDLLLTTASLSNGALTVFEYLWTFVDGNLETIPQRAIVPPGSTDAEQDAKNRLDMELSKLDAERAAFAALGFEVARIPGARVLTVEKGTAAAGVLEPGDRIYRIGDARIADAQAVVDRLQAYEPGDRITIDVVRDAVPKPLQVTLGADPRNPGTPRLGIGFSDMYRLPGNVEIDTQRIGGPSGGLVFALTLVELLGEEDLTRGRTIAVTGTIAFRDGVAVVGDVGGIGHKVQGAVEAGADLFIVPRNHEAEARRAAPAGLEIVGVATLDDAIDALRAD